ncbi:hypothetical protein D3C74_331870 [compost metagenome]
MIRNSSPWAESSRGNVNVSTRLISGTASEARLIGSAYFNSVDTSFLRCPNRDDIRLPSANSAPSRFGDRASLRKPVTGRVEALRQYSSMTANPAAAPAEEPMSAPPASSGSPAPHRLNPNSSTIMTVTRTACSITWEAAVGVIFWWP